MYNLSSELRKGQRDRNISHNHINSKLIKLYKLSLIISSPSYEPFDNYIPACPRLRKLLFLQIKNYLALILAHLFKNIKIKLFE